MLEKQTWMYLLINCIITISILLILFRFQENRIKTLLKKHDKYNKKYDNKHNNKNNLKINNIHDTENIENTENTENESNKVINDIDSFIDPIQNNNTN